MLLSVFSLVLRPYMPLLQALPGQVKIFIADI